MSNRAAEMARIMMEEWPEDETVENFMLRRFPTDKVSDLELAVQILGELEDADDAFEKKAGPQR